ncbi:MAG TPA: ATP-binding cassette domain-containing protein [Candidatus Aquilonibacter sp.]|nr:ATP-binding cassette domain-containing protein [Candidatus Aquilonibacter sp.]
MSTESQTQSGNSPALLRVVGLSKCYWAPRRGPWEKRKKIQAVADANFEIASGETLGLIGNSGAGKSTIARCVARLEMPDRGEIRLEETDIARLCGRDMRRLQSPIQMIFQDPITAMNPRMSAAEIIEEPLLIRNQGTPVQRRAQAFELMREVDLSPDWLDRSIGQFSGGQRQRIAIARALTLKTKVLVLDEALANLDLSTQAQIIDLLRRLQVLHSISYLLISHDLALVASMAENIAILSGGRIVEQGPTRELISNPMHTATKELVRATQELRKGFPLSRRAFA